jgi:hypothetical protein
LSRHNGSSPHDGFRHPALLYAGEADFVARTEPFIRAAVRVGEPILVAVGARQIQLLHESLGEDASRVRWADITAIGRNPARIIPLWREFVTGRRGRLWGIGAPIWSARTPAELVESQLHEVLLNEAFAEAQGFTLLCPYDTLALDPQVIEEAHRSHPVVLGATTGHESAPYTGPEAAMAYFEAPLPEPSEALLELPLLDVSAAALHDVVSGQSAAADLTSSRRRDLALAVAAVAGSVGRHEKARTLRMWREGDTVLAEITAQEPIPDPLAGREWPAPTGGAGRGLWVANQLCNLVQVRSLTGGTVIRLHVGR